MPDFGILAMEPLLMVKGGWCWVEAEGGVLWRPEKPDVGLVFHVDAKVTQDNDRALVGKKDGEPRGKVFSGYKGVANLRTWNLKAFIGGWKSVVQEEHGGCGPNMCAWSPWSLETWGGEGRSAGWSIAKK